MYDKTRLRRIYSSDRHGADRWPRLMVLAAALSLAGCAGRSGEGLFVANAQATTVHLEVVNLNWNPATLYAIHDGRRLRLGELGGTEESEYTFEWPLSRLLSIEIDVVSQGRCVTEQLDVHPGDRLYLEIPPARRFVPGGACET